MKIGVQSRSSVALVPWLGKGFEQTDRNTDPYNGHWWCLVQIPFSGPVHPFPQLPGMVVAESSQLPPSPENCSWPNGTICQGRLHLTPSPPGSPKLWLTVCRQSTKGRTLASRCKVLCGAIKLQSFLWDPTKAGGQVRPPLFLTFSSAPSFSHTLSSENTPLMNPSPKILCLRFCF